MLTTAKILLLRIIEAIEANGKTLVEIKEETKANGRTLHAIKDQIETNGRILHLMKKNQEDCCKATVFVLHEIRKNQEFCCKEITHLLRDIRKLLQSKQHRTVRAAVQFGENTMPADPGTQVVGSTLQAVFQPLEADGVTITPGAVLTTPPTWSSDNEAVATVDSNGLVTGVSAGTATITGTGGVFTDSDGTATAPLDASNTDTVTAPTFRTVSAQVAFV